MSQGASNVWRSGLSMNRSKCAKRLGVRALLRRFCVPHPSQSAPDASGRALPDASRNSGPASWLRLVGLVSFAALSALAQSDDAQTPRAFGGIQPVLSPDGRVIALSFQGAICRMPSTGGTLTRLTRGEGWDIEPAWSPDGKQIAFINAPAFNVGPVRLMTADDGVLVKLPKDVLARGRLQFHPDGRRLLGLFARTGQPDRLQWFDLHSGELTPVGIASLDANQRAAMKWALSPNGAKLLLATFQDR